MCVHLWDHPTSVGLTYWQHARHALGLALTCAKASLMLTVHALCPDVCQTTGTDLMRAGLQQHDQLTQQLDQSQDMAEHQRVHQAYVTYSNSLRLRKHTPT